MLAKKNLLLAKKNLFLAKKNLLLAKKNPPAPAWPGPDPAGFGGYIMMKYRFWTMNNNVLTMKKCFLLVPGHENQ